MNSSSKTNDARGLNGEKAGRSAGEAVGDYLRMDMASHLRLAGTLHEQRQQVQTIMKTDPR